MLDTVSLINEYEFPINKAGLDTSSGNARIILFPELQFFITFTAAKLYKLSLVVNSVVDVTSVFPIVYLINFLFITSNA